MATNQELTQQYHDRTQAVISELEKQLESMKTGSATSEAIGSVATQLAKLRRDFSDATSFLPGYDQRQADKQLEGIEAELEALRASAEKKPKFAFKRKTANPASSPASPHPQASSSSPSTPTKAASQGPTSGLAISGHSREYLTLTSLSSPWSSASDLTISDLDNCIVNLVPSEANTDVPANLHFTALHVRNLSNTVLILPIITGSALLHDMKRCVIALGSRQFRMHTSSQVDVYISISSNPIIEHCSAIRFADYPASLRRLLHVNATEPEHKRTYLAVQDFSHIRATPSPNWCPFPAEATIVDDAWPLAAGIVDDLLQRLLPPS